MNYAPGAGSIAQPVDQQPSTLPLSYGCPLDTRWIEVEVHGNANITHFIASDTPQNLNLPSTHALWFTVKQHMVEINAKCFILFTSEKGMSGSSCSNRFDNNKVKFYGRQWQVLWSSVTGFLVFSDRFYGHQWRVLWSSVTGFMVFSDRFYGLQWQVLWSSVTDLWSSVTGFMVISNNLFGHQYPSL